MLKIKSFYKQPPEIEIGNREYKWKLYQLDNHKLEKFISQMKYRLYEGNGKALYIIGILDNGIPIGITDDELFLSINQIIKVVQILNAKIKNIRYYNGIEGNIATLQIIIDKLEENMYI